MMRVAPIDEEVTDLRRIIHIKNAETFLKIRNEHVNLIGQVVDKMTDGTPKELKERFESIRRQGAYYSVRGERNFVRYTRTLIELNNALRRILVTIQTNNCIQN